jgi:hypothetical protein
MIGQTPMLEFRTENPNLQAKDVKIDNNGEVTYDVNSKYITTDLTDSKIYTDTKSGQTLTDSKIYTDTKSGQTLQSSYDYTDLKSGQTLQAAENYTDTKVSGITSGATESWVTANFFNSSSHIVMDSAKNIVIPANAALFIGNKDTAGCWRLSIDPGTGNLLTAVYSGATYVTKQDVPKE